MSGYKWALKKKKESISICGQLGNWPQFFTLPEFTASWVEYIFLPLALGLTT